MRGRAGCAVRAVGLLLWLGGCSNADEAPQAPAHRAGAVATAPAVPANTVAAGDLLVTALGQREGDILHVRQLQVRTSGRGEPVQVIDGLQTDTPWPANLPGLEAPDMDFDGHADLRLIEFRAAGPNTPWRHWLFDPVAGQFVASAALDALSPTRFDAERRVVIADWRDGAERSGSDTYAWRNGTLQRVTIGP